MAKKSMVLKQQAKPKFSSRAYNRCKICGRPHAYLRDFGICVSASASWLTRARSRVSARHPGKEERFQKGTRKGSFFYVFRQKVSGAHELRSNTLLLGGVYTLSMMFKN